MYFPFSQRQHGWVYRRQVFCPLTTLNPRDDAAYAGKVVEWKGNGYISHLCLLYLATQQGDT